MKKLLSKILLAFAVLFGRGTWLGRDAIFKNRMKRDVGPWVLSEMGAADRNTFVALVDDIFKIEDKQNAAQQWMGMRMQVIATCARNKYGYYLYDPLNNDDLAALSQYPDKVLNEALKAINEMCIMPWLVVPDDAAQSSDNDLEEDEEDKPVNP